MSEAFVSIRALLNSQVTVINENVEIPPLAMHGLYGALEALGGMHFLIEALKIAHDKLEIPNLIYTDARNHLTTAE